MFSLWLPNAWPSAAALARLAGALFSPLPDGSPVLRQLLGREGPFRFLAQSPA